MTTEQRKEKKRKYEELKKRIQLALILLDEFYDKYNAWDNKDLNMIESTLRGK